MRQFRRIGVCIPFLWVAAATVSAQSNAPSASARVTGRVTDSLGTAIVRADVYLRNTVFRTQSGDDGRFELTGVPTGQVEVMVRRVGYTPTTLPLQLAAGEVRDLKVQLMPFVNTLDSVSVVAAPAPPVEKPKLEHIRRGGGTFLDREQIEKRQPRVLTDIFRGISGIKVSRENGVATVISSRTGANMTCPLSYVVDGRNFPLYGQAIDVMMQLVDITSVEVFPGGASMPPQYGGRQVGNCGLIVITTRHAERQPDII